MQQLPPPAMDPKLSLLRSAPKTLVVSEATEANIQILDETLRLVLQNFAKRRNTLVEKDFGKIDVDNDPRARGEFIGLNNLVLGLAKGPKALDTVIESARKAKQAGKKLVNSMVESLSPASDKRTLAKLDVLKEAWQVK